MSKLNMLFSFLRFLSYFAILLLLINPSFDQIKLTVEKPNLVIAIDNSSSIKHLKQDQKTNVLINTLKSNKDLQEKFNVEWYTFGETFKPSDSVSFSEKQTNISNAFNQLSQIYKQSTSPTLLITDGNQTYGQDYEFVTNTYPQAIYPIILGDTISHMDLKIQQLNVNKYAYLKNNFPVEVILVYSGNDQVESKFEVTDGDRTVYSKPIRFSKANNSELINFTLSANSVGVMNYKASITPLENEKNKVNNTKNFAVEVINQKTKIAIVSDFSHPDIGALKKSIESNEQRFVSIVNPKDILNQIDDFQLVIIYQPNNSFKDLYAKMAIENKNTFVIVGAKTDLGFVNRSAKAYSMNITNQYESYQAKLNDGYMPFLIDDIDFESFPPLYSNYGAVKFSAPFETILYKKVNEVTVNEPLLATIETGTQRSAILFGENVWQWRAQSYLNNNSFIEFDNFIGKLIQYLASDKKKSRLNLDYQSFYNGNTSVVIKAEIFDNNYVFDTRETLNITVVDKVTNENKTFPLILKNNYYQVDLSSLEASKYSFTIRATNENIAKSGSFQIVEYDVEQQFLNADVTKLEQLATNSSGVSYFVDDASGLISDLLNDERYVSVQKSNKNTIPLIDWKYLLAIIAISLGLEWFLRKYNGLI
ncbi:VWA domain-containing protein [Tamlana sp. 2201CG12-4]|uniref:VWA domain-containing protein n=1 Tax=Tamlana sp. 2201CG12-4 TaxID=3112582 RepID=UPI002DB56EBD|nr:VWA domain-containing protein [Tamlana sp. 2201CG12-4]MEC3908074.1 VWA domain-containing protein [Tamlana sp. 2201CG12-4]